jgi:hypothetical protein
MAWTGTMLVFGVMKLSSRVGLALEADAGLGGETEPRREDLQGDAAVERDL